MLDRIKAQGGLEMYSLLIDNLVLFSKNFPEFANIPRRIYVETNGRYDGDMAQLIINQFYKHDPSISIVGKLEFESDNGKKAGINKTGPRTKMYIAHTGERLISGNLVIANDACTANKTDGLEKIIKELEREMKAFLWPDADEDNIRLYKRAKSSGKGNNDLAIVVQMLVYFTWSYIAEGRLIKDFMNVYEPIKEMAMNENAYKNYLKQLQ